MNTRVHQSHCCAKHGCKYGDEDCPVVNGDVKQFYYCEECFKIIDFESHYSFNDMSDLYMYCTSFVPEHLLSEMKGFDKYIHDVFLPELTGDIEESEDGDEEDCVDEIEEMKSLIDGVYEIVELFGYKSESHFYKVWAKKWLEKARKYGAKGD
jgi:hypothetical protein